MQNRNTEQRRLDMLTFIRDQGDASVEALAIRFGTSEVTVRKDLAALETSGLVVRRFGGVKALAGNIAEAGPKRLEELDEPKKDSSKRRLGKLAAGLIQDGSRIVIDSGQTAAALLPELESKRNLIVMTNSLRVANTISTLDPSPTLLMTGGTWDPQSESFQGRLAEQMLREYNFDQLFVGADGLDVNRGTTTFNELCSLSRVMAEVATDVIVMAESEKIGRKIPNLELPWQNITTLVTDEHITNSDKEKISAQGVEVLCN